MPFCHLGSMTTTSQVAYLGMPILWIGCGWALSLWVGWVGWDWALACHCPLIIIKKKKKNRHVLSTQRGGGWGLGILESPNRSVCVSDQVDKHVTTANDAL
jgi:hypothetical protein